jgi:paraquat-inducible protein A
MVTWEIHMHGESTQCELTACHDCDLLLSINHTAEHHKCRCPRCGAIVHHRKVNSIDRTLALSVAGLLLYVPAVLLPVMSFDMAGNKALNSLMLGVLILWEQGFWWMALLVFCCSMVFPLFELEMLAFICLSVRLRHNSALLIYLTRKAPLISRWGMLDVYLLGIVVAMIKMGDIGDIVAGPALWVFVMLLLVSMAAAAAFDQQAVWRFVENRRAVR